MSDRIDLVAMLEYGERGWPVPPRFMRALVEAIAIAHGAESLMGDDDVVVTEDGGPSGRLVLLRDWLEERFVMPPVEKLPSAEAAVAEERRRAAQAIQDAAPHFAGGFLDRLSREQSPPAAGLVEFVESNVGPQSPLRPACAVPLGLSRHEAEALSYILDATLRMMEHVGAMTESVALVGDVLARLEKGLT